MQLIDVEVCLQVPLSLLTRLLLCATTDWPSHDGLCAAERRYVEARQTQQSRASALAADVEMTAFVKNIPGGFLTVNQRTPLLSLWNVSQRFAVCVALRVLQGELVSQQPCRAGQSRQEEVRDERYQSSRRKQSKRQCLLAGSLLRS